MSFPASKWTGIVCAGSGGRSGTAPT